MRTEATAYLSPPRRELRCPHCDHVLFDRIVIRSRVLRVCPDGSIEGKCRCKHWLPLPLVYMDGSFPQPIKT